MQTYARLAKVELEHRVTVMKDSKDCGYSAVG